MSESEDSFKAALHIEKNMKFAKSRLLKKVFEEFEVQMQPYCIKYGLKRENTTEYYVCSDGRLDKFYDVISTYPGLNYVVERADMSDRNLQMWFRIEVDHNLFAGFTLFDLSANTRDESKLGYQVQEITQEMYSDVEKYLDKNIFIPKPSSWWLTYCYPNGKIKIDTGEDVPNFKEMNECAVSLIAPKALKKFVNETLLRYEEHLFMKLK